MWSHFDLESDCSKACYHCMGSLCSYMAYYSPLVDGLAFCTWKCHLTVGHFTTHNLFQ